MVAMRVYYQDLLGPTYIFLSFSLFNLLKRWTPQSVGINLFCFGITYNRASCYLWSQVFHSSVMAELIVFHVLQLMIHHTFSLITSTSRELKRYISIEL